MSNSVKILYFAWLRERLGIEEEEVDLPVDITTATALFSWLKARDERFEMALENPDIVNVAVNQVHVAHDEIFDAPREIALFPPMTGG
ncbi:MAG: molybdopterin converting factor subunit 1 [Pseudomonadota bacterium]